MSQFQDVETDSEWPGVQVGIVAIGGAGISIFSHLKPQLPYPCRSVAIDLSQLALDRSTADHLILVGNGQLRPKRSDRVRFLARAAEAQIREAVDGLHFVFLLCGLGGMAGSYISPFVGELLRKMNILTVGAVTLPFPFESASRHAVARKGFVALRRYVDVVVPLNEEHGTATENLDEVLHESVQQRQVSFATFYAGMCHSILEEGMIGVDFDDIRLIFSQEGYACFRFAIVEEGKSLREAALAAYEKLAEAHPEGFRPKGLHFSVLKRAADKFVVINDAINVLKAQLPDECSILFSAVHSRKVTRTEMLLVVTGLENAG